MAYDAEKARELRIEIGGAEFAVDYWRRARDWEAWTAAKERERALRAEYWALILALIEEAKP